MKLNIKQAHERIIIFDLIRGLAIIGVVIYHFAFDLRLLEFIQIDVTQNIYWVAFARILAGSFLALTGISLVLAHVNYMKWDAFFRRFFIIAGAALIISIVTYYSYPDMFVYFGILHAIALFSLLALPFLRLPLLIVFISALLVLILPFIFDNEIFNQKELSWIGFWQVPPFTADLVPIFPAFSATLVGVFLARILIKMNMLERLSNVLPKGVWVNILKQASKWSLVIYLVHQPILLGILYPIAALVKSDELPKDQAFYGACFSSCLEMGEKATTCKSYCLCSLEQVEQGDLWDIINMPILTKEQNQSISSISNLCLAMQGE